MKTKARMMVFTAPILALAGILIAGCGGGGSSTVPPSIQNINGSTTPTSPVNLPIEINGSGFQSAPGKVVFTQGNISANVVPSAGGWSDTGIVAVVPAGNGTTSFTVPGTVSVTVVTSGGTSNAVTVNLVQTLTFSPNNLRWTTTMALPKALTGLRAIPVPGASSTNAFAIVAGGFDGTANTNTVWSNNLNPDGTVGSTTNTTWTTITTNPLPETRAHHAVAEADPTNSLVSANSRFVYVLGGQKASTDAPGGTNTVFMASVDPNTGAVGTWTALSSTLPQTLVGPAVAAFNGYIYVVGGLMSNGSPSNAVYSAPIKSDGTLGAWTTATNAYPMPAVSFAAAFGFGGKLYVVNGDPNGSINPNLQGTAGIPDVNFAGASRGVVGTWTATSKTTKPRLKHNVWSAFGQVIVGEGVYNGNPGSSELESSQVNPDGTLASWNGLTGVGGSPSANVYNAGAFVSPLQSPAATPRFLLLGGQSFVNAGVGALSNKVYVNSQP